MQICSKRPSASECAAAPVVADQVRLSDYYLSDRDLGPDLTARPRSWVAEKLGVLCVALDQFTGRELAEQIDRS